MMRFEKRMKFPLTDGKNMIHTIHVDPCQYDFRSSKIREILFENDSLVYAYPRQHSSWPRVKIQYYTYFAFTCYFYTIHIVIAYAHTWCVIKTSHFFPATVGRPGTNSTNYGRLWSWHRTRCSNRSHVKGVPWTPREYWDHYCYYYYYYHGYYINVSKRSRVLHRAPNFPITMSIACTRRIQHVFASFVEITLTLPCYLSRWNYDTVGSRLFEIIDGCRH